MKHTWGYSRTHLSIIPRVCAAVSVFHWAQLEHIIHTYYPKLELLGPGKTESFQN